MLGETRDLLPSVPEDPDKTLVSRRAPCKDAVARDLDLTRLAAVPQTLDATYPKKMRVSMRGVLVPERESIDGCMTEQVIMLPQRGSVAIACGSGLFLVSGFGPHEARIDYDDTVFDMLLRVNDRVELRGGELIGAGQHWYRFEGARDADMLKLQLLDADGEVQLMVTTRDGGISLGREVGDLVLPADPQLAALHLEIQRDDGSAFLRNLAGPGRTWLKVPPGGRVPADSILAVGARLLRLHTATQIDADVTRPRGQWVPRDSMWPQASSAA